MREKLEYFSEKIEKSSFVATGGGLRVGDKMKAMFLKVHEEETDF